MAATYQACENDLEACAPELFDPQADQIIASKGNRLVNASLEMTWTAASPATAELILGFMVMATDSVCPFQPIVETRGTSPLRVELPTLNHSLDGDCVVHLYVYNPSTVVYQPPLYVYATPAQEFTVKGTLGLEATE